MKIKQYAKAIPVFSAVGLLEQLDSRVPFIVVFKFSDIAVKFLIPLTFFDIDSQFTNEFSSGFPT